MRLLFLHLPRFPVQRRVLEAPALANATLVLHVEEKGSQRVRFASGAAQREGVRVGQTVAAAMAQAPDLQRFPFDGEAERRALHALGEHLLPLSPGFQVDGPEGLWLDACAAHLSGGEAAWAKRVLGELRALGFQGRGVVGSERFTTRALARWGAAEAVVVEPGGGGALAQLPLLALEGGLLGDGVVEAFRALGVTSLGEVAALSEGALTARFGALGRQAARLCRGADDARFTADALPEVLLEEVKLDWPAEQLEPLLFSLKAALDRVCQRLQGRQQAAVRLAVSFTLDGLGERGQAGPLVMPLRLARPTSQGKRLLELVRHQLQDMVVDRPVAAVAVRVEEACADEGRQLLLGDAPEGDAALEVVLSKLQSALGEDALFSAAPVSRHRPEAGWKAVPFRPPDAGQVSELWGLMETELVLTGGGGAGTGRNPSGPHGSVSSVFPGSAPSVHPEPVEGAAVTSRPSTAAARRITRLEQAHRAKVEGVPVGARPVRLFSKPSPLTAEVSSTGEMAWVHLVGRRRRVQAVWGPERLTGDWWEEGGFARDYYRVQLEGVGELWVFKDGRDGRYYAQGVFD